MNEACIAKPRPMTAFDTIERAVSEVAEIANRVTALAAKLVGENQQPTQGKERIARGGGHFGVLADHGDSIRTAVSGMHEALLRIEQQLP